MSIARLMIVSGLILIALGAVLIGLNKLNVPIGRLPGDAVVRGKNTTFYFPWVTCLLLSLLGSVLLWFLNRNR